MKIDGPGLPPSFFVESPHGNSADAFAFHNALLNARGGKTSEGQGTTGGEETSDTEGAFAKEKAAYDKLLNDIKNGADEKTIIEDAARLAVLAGGNGDDNLASIARAIGNSAGNGTYDAKTARSALEGAPAGTAEAQTASAGKDDAEGTEGPKNDLGSVFLTLQSLIEHRAGLDKIAEAATRVKDEAKKTGNEALVQVADKILKSISNGTFDPVEGEKALMTHAASAKDLGLAPEDA